jgi:acyl dehydratase
MCGLALPPGRRVIDPKHIGYELPTLTVTVEPGRLAFFAKAIGETDPIYSDVTAARAAGHPHLPVPPTFFFSLDLERPDQFGWFNEVGLDLKKVLHGEQAFTYHRLAYAGQTLTLRSKVTDAYDKKNGALTFVVRKTWVTDLEDRPVAELESVIVQRNA